MPIDYFLFICFFSYNFLSNNRTFFLYCKLFILTVFSSPRLIILYLQHCQFLHSNQMWCHRQWIITSIEEYMEIAPNVMLLDFFFLIWQKQLKKHHIIESKFLLQKDLNKIKNSLSSVSSVPLTIWSPQLFHRLIIILLLLLWQGIISINCR